MKSFPARSALLLVLAACIEQAPTGARIPVLDDVGHGNWASVSTGQDHTCALDTGGRAYCWGHNAAGQLGIAKSDTVCDRFGTPCVLEPRAVETPVRFFMISAGSRHTCAIAMDRSAWCWGDDSNGALGSIVPSGPTPVRVPGTLGWTDISAGFSHTCAVRTDGAAYCWGLNDRGQLGTGDFASSPAPVRAARRLTVVSISAGFGRTCARVTTGIAYCWGADWIYNQGGLDYTQGQTFASSVPGAPQLVAVTVGAFATCGLDEVGAAFCWEANSHGEMGTGTTTGSRQPVAVSGGLRFVAVSAGLIQTCGITAAGSGWCWGDDSFGQLGISPRSLFERCAAQNLACSTRPVQVYGRQRFVSISTGLGSHTCGVTTQGNLYCWGLGVSGQLGEGLSPPRVSEVVPMLVQPPRS